jgi:hypothetical protein
MQAVLGSPDGQARWEAYMMLLALKQWADMGGHGIITLVGDAEGVLGALTRLRSADMVINAIAMELALWLAPRGLAVEGLHIWGEENTAADQLSRLSQGAAIPWHLAWVNRSCLVPRTAEAWTFIGRLLG